MRVIHILDTRHDDITDIEAYNQATSLAFCLSKIKEQCREWYSYDSRGSIPISEVHETIMSIINEHCNLEKMGY